MLKWVLLRLCSHTPHRAADAKEPTRPCCAFAAAHTNPTMMHDVWTCLSFMEAAKASNMLWCAVAAAAALLWLRTFRRRRYSYYLAPSPRIRPPFWGLGQVEVVERCVMAAHSLFHAGDLLPRLWVTDCGCQIVSPTAIAPTPPPCPAVLAASLQRCGSTPSVQGVA